MKINFPSKKRASVLALGGESAGNFSVFQGGQIYFSEDFGDLLEEKNWKNYQKAVLKHLKDNRTTPKIILSDLHPHFRTTLWGKELAKKHEAKHISVQHHIAHIFSAIGDKIMPNTSYLLPATFYGIALDGTGYGTDGKIWGGEIFQITKHETRNTKLKIERVGYLENQMMIGGELAIREPARMLIAILDKIFSIPPSPLGRGCPVLGTGEGKNEQKKKNKIYSIVKKYYSKNEFELLYNQLQQNFNCLETSSTGRVLDAVSLLLGFCGNERKYKHEPIDMLEKNSSIPYCINPKIIASEAGSSVPLEPNISGKTKYNESNIISPEKKVRARTPEPASIHYTSYILHNTFIAGGIANNKIISAFLESKGVYTNKKIYPVKSQKFNGVPRGDAGLSFGQIIYHLLS